MILAVESSGKTESVALMEGERLLFEQFADAGLTHSKTLAPMIEGALAACGLSPADISVYAVSAGPGSFTGLRIGVATVKGMAWAQNKPCAAVSSLEGMAWSHRISGRAVGAVIDAKGGRVYGGFFEGREGRVFRLTEDLACTVQELAEQAKKLQKKYLLVGDGAELCYNIFLEKGIDVSLAPADIRGARASGIAAAARQMEQEGRLVSPQMLTPAYLRRPQAERERLEKLEEAGKK